MTVIVGIRCDDGVVVGSDSSLTFGAHHNALTIEQRGKKTFVVERDVILAGTGQIGMGQRFAELLARIRRELDPKWGSLSPIAAAKIMCVNARQDFAESMANMGQYGALVAFSTGGQFHLCEFGIEDFQPELKVDDVWFASIGGGQPIADPFLGMIRRVFFQNSRPKLKEAIFSAVWALDLVIELNTGGIGGPLQIAVLENAANCKPVARLLDDNEIQEHYGNMKGAEAHLAEYASILSGSQPPTKTAPPPPSPPA